MKSKININLEQMALINSGDSKPVSNKLWSLLNAGVSRTVFYRPW